MSGAKRCKDSAVMAVKMAAARYSVRVAAAIALVQRPSATMNLGRTLVTATLSPRKISTQISGPI